MTRRFGRPREDDARGNIVPTNARAAPAYRSIVAAPALPGEALTAALDASPVTIVHPRFRMWVKVQSLAALPVAVVERSLCAVL